MEKIFFQDFFSYLTISIYILLILMKSLYQFRLLDELKASDTQVRISQLIGRKNEDWSLRDVEFQKETVVLQNGDGSVFEMAFASASGGILTFHKRGLDENNPPVEKVYNKKTWGNGTKCYVTAGAGDFIDKDEAQVWNGEQTFTGWVLIQKELKAEGQIDAKRGVKNPIFATKEEATAYFTETEKVEGLLVNIKGNTYRRNSITKSWEMLGLADINQEKVQENSTKISTLESKVEKSEKKIEKLEEGNWADHLELRSFFWDREKNVTPAEEVVFVRQKLPVYEFSNLELNLGKDAADKEIHIQRLSSGIPSDELSFKLKKVQLPITDIEVEVRKGVVVNVDAETCYWYGGELLAAGVITNNKITVDYSKITVELNKAINLPKGGLYSIVLRQAGGIVNTVNYYQIGCDTTQRSTVFGAVKVNGVARTPTRWMAFCDSEAFLEESVVLYRPQNDQEVYSIARMGDYNSGEGETIEFICPIDNPLVSFRNATSGSYWMVTGFYFIQNGKRFPINRNRPPQKVLLKRWTVKLCLEGYRSHIVEIKLMFNANSEGLKVIGKHGTRYTLGESYWFGLAGFFNDKRVGPQIDTANPTTSATTGTIPPGNYVTYLTVIGPDGKKYKIWAYAE